MQSTINQVELKGIVQRQPEHNVSSKGIDYTYFVLEVTDPPDSKRKIFVDCMVYGNLSNEFFERINQNHHIYIQGSLHCSYRKYGDKMHKAWYVKVEFFTCCFMPDKVIPIDKRPSSNPHEHTIFDDDIPYINDTNAMIDER